MTYTVFNIEDEDADDLSGLTLEDAVDRLLMLARCSFSWRRIDGMMTMDICPQPWRTKPLTLFSGLQDDEAAQREVMQRFVTGEILMPGPWCIERDDVFGFEMARHDAA